MTGDGIDPVAIRAALARMREADRMFHVYGTSRHRYKLGPTLTEAEIEAFEARWQIRFPEDYRVLLKEVGDGAVGRSDAPYIAINAGPGPGYGLFPLSEAEGDADPRPPFPGKEAITPEMREHWGDDWRIPGVLELGYGGGGQFWYLIVNGLGYGNVIGVDYGGEPNVLTFEGPFAAWYMRWIHWLVERALPMLAHTAHTVVYASRDRLSS